MEISKYVHEYSVLFFFLIRYYTIKCNTRYNNIEIPKCILGKLYNPNSPQT